VINRVIIEDSVLSMNRLPETGKRGKIFPADGAGDSCKESCPHTSPDSRDAGKKEGSTAVTEAQYSTGLPGLDSIIKELIPGDNIVWQINSLDDYRLFVKPFCDTALRRGQPVTYFRFSKHPPLIVDNPDVKTFVLNPENGFESFVLDLHQIVHENGRGGCYVFDCLSDLAADWFSDQMLANFFMLTCPFLLDMEAIAYFAIEKFKHSSYATSPIVDTTQLFLDIYHYNDKVYIHPIKVEQRYSTTMHMLHHWKDDEFVPVTSSSLNAAISASRQYDIWNRTFKEGQTILENIRNGIRDPEAEDAILDKLLRMSITRDEKLFGLVREYFTLEDVLEIGKRIIGTGLIGGKSVGMLLSRAILRKNEPRLDSVLEIHDSFYIGSDIFYTFLVQNGCWWAREQQKDLDHFLQHAEHARRLIHRGRFPDYIVKFFSDMLDYYGQSPIIVRSSSLLEDNFGNAFSGKYESVFRPNRGPREKCLEDLMIAIKTIYASTMSEKALLYRAQFDLLGSDEQMSLLVQRVSGDMHSNIFYPYIAGVAYSFNPYVWSDYIDPASGMLRLVFGLGTRAVDRSDSDYTRIVALNAPERRPESGADELRRYSQKRVDVLDLNANRLVSLDFEEVMAFSPDLNIDLIASRDLEMEKRVEESGKSGAYSGIITFDGILRDTDFVANMREMLRVIHEAYRYPVDVEFTANLTDDGGIKINLVQCRPFQAKNKGAIAEISPDIGEEDIVFRTGGPVIGQSRIGMIDRVIYVVPNKYSELRISDKYTVAQMIGKIVKKEGVKKQRKILLMGPGRWGTTTPSLGVPVAFSDISNIEYLCEIVAMSEGIVPDVSLGTHFFNDLVDFDILYLAVYPDRQDTVLKSAVFENAPNKLTSLLPDAGEYEAVIKVLDTSEIPELANLRLYADTQNQSVVCYKER